MSHIALGKPVAPTTAPTTEEEWQKVVLARLLRGDEFVLFDNVDQSLLSSAAFASTLTALTISGRILGASKIVDAANRAVWGLTGNNNALNKDNSRRAVIIRLDANCPHPEDRSNFAIADLRAYVREHRSELLAAVLTICRSWLIGSKPPSPATPHLGSFEEWVTLVGGVLHFAGVEGFLENRTEMRDELDPETREWTPFVESVHAKMQVPVGSAGNWSANQLAKRICDASSGQLHDDVPAELSEVRHC